MGRIDEALRRSNLDASQGTGAEAPSPAPAPWGFEQQEDGDSAAPRQSPASGSAAEETPGRSAGWRKREAGTLDRVRPGHH